MYKSDRVEHFGDTLESLTHVQFRKPSAAPQFQPREGPDLIKLLWLCATVKIIEPAHRESRFILPEQKSGAVHSSVINKGSSDVANNVVGIGQVLAGHTLTSDVRSKARICFLIPDSVSEPETLETSSVPRRFLKMT